MGICDKGECSPIQASFFIGQTYGAMFICICEYWVATYVDMSVCGYIFKNAMYMCLFVLPYLNISRYVSI